MKEYMIAGYWVADFSSFFGDLYPQDTASNQPKFALQDMI
jgi:hypothetical protein